MSKIRTVGAGIVILAAAAASTIAVAPTASAAPTATVSVTTQRMSAATLKSRQVGTYSRGKQLSLSCYVRGQSVKGHYSRYIPGGWDNIWYAASDGYWVADVDINTRSNKPIAPYCKTGRVAVTTQRMSGPSLKTSQSGTYSAGRTLALSCYKRGQSVKGHYSRYIPGGWSNLWYRVNDGRWVADVDINTGSNKPITGQCPVQQPTGTSNSSYLLPFHKGQRFIITQGPKEHAAGLYPAYNRYAIDLKTPSGTPIIASRTGKINLAGRTSTGAIEVRIDHGGDTCSQYSHLSRTVVSKGQSVSQGQLLGYAGNTGISSGSHLHFGLVKCSSGLSKAVVKTVEMGTNYPVGALSAPSRNR